ncbi:MAG TPA: response regulator [Ohtaekwangia sp.]|uniref:response regulator n=1 Tax=Ohtaekwangia sp. TaxID=2066019 RepID=UPI002F952860
MKILLIDDEELDVFIAQRLLSLEYDITGVTSDEQAIRWAKENHFDVVLIDYYLNKGKLGNQLLRELIAIRGPVFKAFLLTNYIDSRERDTLKKDGFQGIIDKPLTLEKFRTCMELG